MNHKLSEAIHLPTLTPALQLVDYWSALTAIVSYVWFNGAMIVAAGAAEET